MTFKIKIRKKALKFIQKQDSKTQTRLFEAIYAIPLGDIRKMAGEDKLYRLRVGDMRVLFEMSLISDEVTLIDVTNAGNRGQIYK
jgi:mRNA interferase RelE/StbE